MIDKEDDDIYGGDTEKRKKYETINNRRAIGRERRSNDSLINWSRLALVILVSLVIALFAKCAIAYYFEIK